MKWFSGKVDIAIQVSARNKALLVVFIDSADENGEAMDKVWGEIDNSILSCNHIALKIKDEEDVAKIISLLPESERFDAPVSLFITSAGEVVGKVTAADVAQLKDVVSQVNQKLAPKKIESQVIPIISSSASSSSASSTAPSSGPTTGASTSQSEDPSTSSTETPPRPPISRAEKELLLQEKMNRARVLLEQKKKADAELKRREEKKKEMERIKESKMAAEAAKKRQEKEMQDAAKQRKVDQKMLEQERLRVRAQFLADREEKDFRENRTGAVSSENVRRRDTHVAPPVDNGRARILVRFTDGRTITETYESSSPLTAVIDSINESGFISKPYTLVRPYPRTQYAVSDYTKSFLELQLTPSSVLYVQEEPEKKGFFDQGIFSLFSMVIKAPFTALSTIYGMFFGTPQRTLNVDEGPTVRSPETARQVRDMDSLRQQRVTRLHSSEDSESDSDENPNWNGNSTQYL
ncbi:unnamed protein product [Auanema sp. JU1783]|nr:unnamed protein product [Auanema sp. JU1783]